jgi:hypothetical protein
MTLRLSAGCYLAVRLVRLSPLRKAGHVFGPCWRNKILQVCIVNYYVSQCNQTLSGERQRWFPSRELRGKQAGVTTLSVASSDFDRQYCEPLRYRDAKPVGTTSERHGKRWGFPPHLESGDI